MKPFTAVATAAVATAALTMGAFWLLDDEGASDLETSRSLEQPQSRMIDSRDWRWESNRGKPSVTFRHYDLASHWPTGIERFDGGWVQGSREVHGVHVTVFTDDDRVRAHIFDSARTVEGTDSYGCSVHHPAAVGRDYRPDAGRDGLAAVGARDVVAATLAAPEGSGPNMPGGCVPEYDYGEEMLVLTVRGSKAVLEVVLRYDGCIGHGTDDGVTKRRLTKESAGPLFDGPHLPGGVSGPYVVKRLDSDR